MRAFWMFLLLAWSWTPSVGYAASRSDISTFESFEIPARLAPEVQIPAEIHAVPDLRQICLGKELCLLDEYFQHLPSDKGMPQFFQDIYESFSNYAKPLNQDEKVMVEKGLSFLNQTELGKAICQGLVGGQCGIAALEAKGVVIQAGILGDNMSSQTLMWGGKVLVVISREPQYANKKALDWGTTLGHEMSHAEDYKKFRRGLKEAYRADTELKAYLSDLAVYNDLKLRYPRKIKDPVRDFLIEVWDWKENGGPYPKDFYIDGEKMSAKEFLGKYIEPANDGVSAIRNAVANYFYRHQTLQWNLLADDVMHSELLRITLKRGIEYDKWRKKVLAGQYPPHDAPQGGSSPGWWHPGSGGEEDGGTGNGYPFNPNPHFQPWQ